MATGKVPSIEARLQEIRQSLALIAVFTDRCANDESGLTMDFEPEAWHAVSVMAENAHKSASAVYAALEGTCGLLKEAPPVQE